MVSVCNEFCGSCFVLAARSRELAAYEESVVANTLVAVHSHGQKRRRGHHLPFDVGLQSLQMHVLYCRLCRGQELHAALSIHAILQPAETECQHILSLVG